MYCLIQKINCHLITMQNVMGNINMMSPDYRKILEDVGIQMINIGIGFLRDLLILSPYNPNNNSFDCANRLKHISSEIENLSIQFRNNPIIQMPNFNDYIISEILNKAYFTDNKFHVTFTSTQGLKTVLSIENESTIKDMLNQYLIHIQRPELIHNNINRVYFFYGGTRLSFDDNRRITEIFYGNREPRLNVHYY